MIGLEYVGRGADVVVVLASGLPLGLQRLLGLPDAFLLVLETKAATLSNKLHGWVGSMVSVLDSGPSIPGILSEEKKLAMLPR